MLAIFSYGFDIAKENIKNADLDVHTLSNYDYLIDTAQRTSYIKESEVELLKSWRKDPAKWIPES